MRENEQWHEHRGERANMPDEAIQMPQIGDALVEQPARLRPSFLGRLLGQAWTLVAFAGPLPPNDQSSDGLEAFDMLGGWKGTDAGRRDDS